MKTNKTEKPMHTEGEWTDGPEPCDIIGGSNPYAQVVVAMVYTKADKALVKAAPDLLSAAQNAVNHPWGPLSAEDKAVIDLLAAAIAKAEGR